MPRNGQGIYTLPIGNPVITGTTITSTWGNTTMQDIANALTGSVASDGQTTMSGPLNMGSNRINNVDNPVLPQDAATMDYVDTLVGDLGTMARQNADNVQITGGSIIGVFLDLSGTAGQMYIPVGTTAQRTNSPKLGLFRFNTDTLGQDPGFYEGWTPAGWRKFVTVAEGNYSIDYLAIGGGAGGAPGQGGGGGGGSGGVQESTLSVIPGSTELTITIGGGGAVYTDGALTQIVGVVTVNGGSRGNYPPDQNYGGPGGASGEGYGGGAGAAKADGGGSGGGGGGSAEAGVAGNAGGPGRGGNGYETLITGEPMRVAGGGGGAGGGGSAGGLGGGGNGSAVYSAGSAGAINTGSGGGGGTNMPAFPGGSGCVYLSMDTASYSGQTTGSPTIITSGLKTILKYTQSGSYTA